MFHQMADTDVNNVWTFADIIPYLIKISEWREASKQMHVLFFIKYFFDRLTYAADVM